MKRQRFAEYLVAVPDADHNYTSIFNYAINYQIILEGTDPDRRKNLTSFARHYWIVGGEFEQGKEPIVISFGDQCSENADAFFCNRNNILVRLNR